MSGGFRPAKIGGLTRIRGAIAIAAMMVAALSLLLSGCSPDATDDVQARAESGVGLVSITDQAGREVTVPAQIDKVYCTSPLGTNMVYTLAPEVLVGWNIRPTELEQRYIPEEYRSIVGLGGWFGKNTTGNVEEIIKRAPDIVLNIGTTDAGSVSDSERVQGLLNIPVVMVDSTLIKTGDAYRFLGELLGYQERAEELAAYADKVIQEALEGAATLAGSDRVSIYYAEGAKGLNTDPEGSEHTEVFTIVGARNVADVQLQEGYGMSPVSLEQVIAWDPEVIIVASDPAEESTAFEQITTSSDWATIAAVKNKQVYVIPHGPFDWVDRPYSIGRLMGIPWVGNILYPDLYDFDLAARVKEFYELFYHFDLDDAELQGLMTHAFPVR